MIYIVCLQKPPNFLLQAELCSYVTQEVVVPPEEDEPPDANLIDTTDSSQDRVDNSNVATALAEAHMTAIVERDNLIQHLQLELERLR